MNAVIGAAVPTDFQEWNQAIAGVLGTAYSVSILWVLIVCLLGAGIWYTIATRGVQFRLFGHMVGTIFGSRRGSKGGISSFQAFTISLADRVGTGNIAGVALAIVAGGPGAVFWMWVVAMVGMATAFIEATLAQIFKVRNPDGTFRGGPAFYIERGLGSRAWGIVFAVLLIFAYGFSFQMIQANTVAQVAFTSFHVEPWVSAIILLLLTGPFFIGGVKPVARLAEFLAPIMAILYLLLAIGVVGMHYDMLGRVFSAIFADAFGLRQAAGGVIGGLVAALEQGTKRGLFSNEAGMGSAPHAAATATVNHPVKQGLVQSLGVFADTIIVCTCTALIVLVGGVYKEGMTSATVNGAALTTDSIGVLGHWSKPIMFCIICAFAFSTLLGNYTYAEANIKYLRGISARGTGIKLLSLFSVALGAVASLDAVWGIADWATALMTIVNLVAVMKLGKWVVGALRDYEAQRREHGAVNAYFCVTDNPYLPAKLDSDVWDRATVDAEIVADREAADHPTDPGLKTWTERYLEADI